MCWKFVFAECHSLSFFSEINWTWVFEIWYFKAGIFKMGSFIRRRASFPAQLWSCQLVINFKKIISIIVNSMLTNLPISLSPTCLHKILFTKVFSDRYTCNKNCYSLACFSHIARNTHTRVERSHTAKTSATRFCRKKEGISLFSTITNKPPTPPERPQTAFR